MGKLEASLDFLDGDISIAERQWEGTRQFMSMLQRSGVTYQKLREIFDPSDDEAGWCGEYSGEGRSEKLKMKRKRLSFLKASRKEFAEEYDESRSDVDYIRLLEVPFTDSKYDVEYGSIEMKDL